ncbi:MAG: patatin-like phospholipase family protein [Rikenellaceae bacterium]|nr:patatin-like phospholipase family protein [Rikenellaceae bacterium]
MKYLTAVIVFFSVLSVSAQKVGLVLSGGGAKGLYHIGLIKALEENNIPIDYIAGTSMGSIVAGLYSIGYSPEEMEKLFLSDQVKLWLTGKIESRYFFYFKRMYPDQSMVTLNLDFKSKNNIAALPTNIIPSTQIDMSFIDIFSAASAVAEGDFDNLPIPFRCVASDVYNKKQVVFRSGDVGTAIRSSMSIPFVFKPVKEDSVLLYDGGIYNNFPWEVVENDFDPDILIGGKCVDGGTKLPDENNLMEQIEAIMMMRTDYDLPEDKGIMVERIFKDVSMLDFSRAQYIIDAGYQDAMQLMDSIKMRIPRRVSDEELYNKRLAFRSLIPQLIFEDYEIKGLNPGQERYVSNLLGFNHGDEKFTFQEFKSEYFKMLSEGDIVSEFPHVFYDDTTGYFKIGLELKTKPSFRIKVGGNISSTYLNQAYVGLEYKIIDKSAYSFRFDGTLGSLYTSMSLGLRSDFYLWSPFYYDLFFNYNNYNYSKGSDKSQYANFGFNQSIDKFLSVSLGMPPGRSTVLQFRVNYGVNDYKYYNTTEDKLAEIISRSDFNYVGVQLELLKNTLDYSQYPTNGVYQSASVIYVNGNEKYKDNGLHIKNNKIWFGAKFSREDYFSLAKWFSLGLSAEAVVTTRPSFHDYHLTNFTAPSFTPTSYSKSLYIDRFRGDSYIGLGIMPTFHFMDNFYLKNNVYAFAADKFDSDFVQAPSQRIRYIFNSTLVYQTPIGAASLTLTNFDAGKKNRFVVFNFGYTIFNRKGLFY